MPHFHVPVILEVEASNYEEATNIAASTLFVGKNPKIVDAYITFDVERDNENQRVIYLHNEDIPLER